MRRPSLMACLLSFGAMLFVADGTASAGLVPTTVSVSPNGGNFKWTYGIVLPSEMKLENGNYFTIYDFSGIVPGTVVAPSGWSVTSSNIGQTPSLLGPLDDPNISNLTFTYTGPTIPAGHLWLGNFSIDSVFEYHKAGAFTATNPRAASGDTDQNVTMTFVPTGIPEPATLFLFGLGLPLLPLLRQNRRIVPAGVA